jgi:N6-L-threonylcarbamoyladenine synthase
VERLLKQGAPAGEVARAVFGCIANTLEKVLRHAVQETGIRRILIVGGVAANSIIRERLRERLVHRAVAAEVSFGTVEFSGDNAVGVALKAARMLAGGEAPSVGE